MPPFATLRLVASHRVAELYAERVEVRVLAYDLAETFSVVAALQIRVTLEEVHIERALLSSVESGPAIVKMIVEPVAAACNALERGMLLSSSSDIFEVPVSARVPHGDVAI